ncbi:MAG: TIGR01777 family protein [Clostridia bacterium]|nr:TIGR01777 family protein [Clostridia bacterium]
MKIVIIGATGFIGSRLFSFLDKEEYDLTVVTRHVESAREQLGDHAEFCQWDGEKSEELDKIFKDAWAVINLAGESLSGGRWTEARKERILQSRLNTTHAVVEAINRSEIKPRVLLQASAIGYYGSQPQRILDEDSAAGNNFLAQVTRQWEAATAGLDASVRLVILRTGIVLGTEGGALPQMAMPFRFGVGGRIGSGKQWFSWIHLDDEVRAIQFLLEHKEASGAYNLTAPEPVKMKDVAKELARVLHRPNWLHIPKSLIRLVMGQMGDEMLLASQKVVPKRLEEEGFSFHFEDFRLALTNIYNS